MGRRAGVSADETKSQILDAAARVFALKGYDGATIADITNEAGLSSGAIYAHHGNKAELFVAVVREHAQTEFLTILGLAEAGERGDTSPSVADVVTEVGSTYATDARFEADLMLEAVVAAKRHPEVAELVQSWLADGESLLGLVLQQAQHAGEVDDTLDAAAVSRFVMMVALGARIAAALDMPPVDEQAWGTVIERMVDAARRAP